MKQKESGIFSEPSVWVGGYSNLVIGQIINVGNKHGTFLIKTHQRYIIIRRH
jgi:hypothetical protein